jgi:hypothetical protein
MLTVDNLNRVSYATLDAALHGELKVTEATTFLQRHCPQLVVTPYPMTFDTFKRQIPQREDRKYDVIVRGLDNDDARWEVERDLQRILIDGATGRDMVARVERVEFGQYGCLGCSRVPAPAVPGQPVNCDAPPDEVAASLSFLLAFPGFLAAGETIKEAGPGDGLRGRFDHVFRYGPNPDLVGTPGFRPDCTVGCQRPSKLAQYCRKTFPVPDDVRTSSRCTHRQRAGHMVDVALPEIEFAALGAADERLPLGDGEDERRLVRVLGVADGDDPGQVARHLDAVAAVAAGEARICARWLRLRSDAVTVAIPNPWTCGNIIKQRLC